MNGSLRGAGGGKKEEGVRVTSEDGNPKLIVLEKGA